MSNALRFVVQRLKAPPLKECCFGWIQADTLGQKNRPYDEYHDIYAILKKWRNICLVSSKHISEKLRNLLTAENIGLCETKNGILLFRQTSPVLIQTRLLQHILQHENVFGSVQKGEANRDMVIGILLGYKDENIIGFVKRIMKLQSRIVDQSFMTMSLERSKRSVRILARLF
jgi:hypothetical protein